MIWIGLDGLDFEVVDRLAAEGRMPNWKRLASEGYTARLKSFFPILSPIVWTTLATGVGPDVHRVMDFQEVDPASGQKVPISGNSRAVPAIWNVASAEGLSVGVVGWWASHPAEEVKGFFVSDHASAILFQGLTQDGVAFPASLSPGVGQIMARDGRVEDAELARFLDMSSDEIARERASAKGLENPVAALARTIGATRVESRIARELYDRNLPDLTMLYFEGTDVIGHLFASDVAPRLECIGDEDFRAVSPDRRRVLRDGRPAARPMDAPRRRGRGDADRELGSRLQVGRRPVLREGLARFRDGGLLASAGGRVRGLGRERAERGAAGKRERLRRRADRGRAPRTAGRHALDRQTDTGGVRPSGGPGP